MKKKKAFDMATDCMVCGKRIGHRGFCSKKCHDEHHVGLSELADAQQPKQKVYCKNCRHYNLNFEWFDLLVVVCGFAFFIYGAYEYLLMGLVGVVIILIPFCKQKRCSKNVKEYEIKDTPEEHTEEMKVLNEWDLNSHNDCKYYEVK